MFSCETCEIFKNTFIYRTPQVAASIYVDFAECFFFYFSIAALLLYFLTVLLLSLFEETLSSLYHHYYIITVIIAEWFVRTAATATTYCTAISMIVIGISALRHTGIPGLWTQELDAELWKLDSGCWTLNVGGWILDSWRSALDYRH